MAAVFICKGEGLGEGWGTKNGRHYSIWDFHDRLVDCEVVEERWYVDVHDYLRAVSELVSAGHETIDQGYGFTAFKEA